MQWLGRFYGEKHLIVRKHASENPGRLQCRWRYNNARDVRILPGHPQVSNKDHAWQYEVGFNTAVDLGDGTSIRNLLRTMKHDSYRSFSRSKMREIFFRTSDFHLEEGRDMYHSPGQCVVSLTSWGYVYQSSQ